MDQDAKGGQIDDSGSRLELVQRSSDVSPGSSPIDFIPYIAMVLLTSGVLSAASTQLDIVKPNMFTRSHASVGRNGTALLTMTHRVRVLLLATVLLTAIGLYHVLSTRIFDEIESASNKNMSVKLR